MTLPNHIARLHDVILKSKLVDELQMKSALARLDNWGGRLPTVLIELGFADEEALVEAIGKAFRLPVVHLGTAALDPQARAKMDAAYCKQRGIFPVSFSNRTLTLAVSDPADISIIDEVQQKYGVRVVPVLAAESEIQVAIARHYLGQELKVSSNRARRAVTTEVQASDFPGGGLELDTSAPPAPGAARKPSSNTLLDEMLDGGDFSEADLARLETVRVNQARTSAILGALASLLAEKGYGSA